jgi:hypothetical protein
MQQPDSGNQDIVISRIVVTVTAANDDYSHRHGNREHTKQKWNRNVTFAALSSFGTGCMERFVSFRSVVERSAAAAAASTERTETQAQTSTAAATPTPTDA